MLTEALVAPPFSEKAICAQTDPEAFFPEKGGSTRPAKRICLGCEVRDACLQYALDHDERYGIWGGYSERERRRIKHGEMKPAATQLQPFEAEKYTRSDGHGYRGYKQGCKCTICKAGYANYHYDYQRRAGLRPDRFCEQCGAKVSGHGRSVYCSTDCSRRAKALRRARARRSAGAA
jgi:hypothetical protein